MRISNQTPPQIPQQLRNRQDAPQAPPAATAQDMVLLGRINRQENIVRLSHTVPYASAIVGAATVYYLAKSIPISGMVGLPTGLLLGAGLAEYMSNSAMANIERYEAQLSSHGTGGK